MNKDSATIAQGKTAAYPTAEEQEAMLAASKAASVAAGLDAYATWPTGATVDGWTFKVNGSAAEAAIVEAELRNGGIWPPGQTLHKVIAVGGTARGAS